MQFPKPQKEAKTETVPHFHCPKLSEKYNLFKVVSRDSNYGELTNQIYWEGNVMKHFVTKGSLALLEVPVDGLSICCSGSRQDMVLPSAESPSADSPHALWVDQVSALIAFLGKVCAPKYNQKFSFVRQIIESTPK